MRVVTPDKLALRRTLKGFCDELFIGTNRRQDTSYLCCDKK